MVKLHKTLKEMRSETNAEFLRLMDMPAEAGALKRGRAAANMPPPSASPDVRHSPDLMSTMLHTPPACLDNLRESTHPPTGDTRSCLELRHHAALVRAPGNHVHSLAHSTYTGDTKPWPPQQRLTARYQSLPASVHSSHVAVSQSTANCTMHILLQHDMLTMIFCQLSTHTMPRCTKGDRQPVPGNR